MSADDGKICPQCNGSRRQYEILFDPPYPCDTCGGVGRVYDEPMTADKILALENRLEIAHVYVVVAMRSGDPAKLATARAEYDKVYREVMAALKEASDGQ